MRVTPEQYRELIGQLGKPKRNKHGNVKVDGFDSKAERNRYAELALMEKAGQISNLRSQVDIPLIVNGELVCTYRADAVYIDEHGREVVEDTKSAHTRKLPEYRIKRKLYRALFGKEIKEWIG